LRAAGDDQVSSAFSVLGPEQEFFLIDKKYYEARPDLVACGRTVIGAPPAKGQQLEDHYFGTLPSRVLDCLQEVEWTLWRLGVPCTTRHCEVAPSQYELAPVFDRVAVAADQNLITMIVLREVAEKHGLVALLYEKPFAGVNGSGKHNNWSIITDKGENLLDPTANPEKQPKFLLTLAATLRAVDINGDILRAAIAVPGNEHRLGANEAPPAIISAYLGTQLNHLVETLAGQNPPPLEVFPRLDLAPGAGVLPTIPREQSDRNRTSPFAFTGNKFEFRAVGSSQNCSRPVAFLNAIVADSMLYVAELLEQRSAANGGRATPELVDQVTRELMAQHRRCVFEGNGYSREWAEEATNVRKMWHLRTLPEAVAQLRSEKNVALFSRLKIFSPAEIEIQQNTMYESYCKVIEIEGNVLREMADLHILPAAVAYKQTLLQTMDLQEENQRNYVQEVNRLISELIAESRNVRTVLEEAHGAGSLHDEAVFYRTRVVDANNQLRRVCDRLEGVIPAKSWPFPKYHEMLLLK